MYSFASLLKDMCYSTDRSVAPLDFKKAIAKKNPQYVGFQQQDSQELLT